MVRIVDASSLVSLDIALQDMFALFIELIRSGWAVRTLNAALLRLAQTAPSLDDVCAISQSLLFKLADHGF